MNCISCLMVCKIFFSSEYLDILEKSRKKQEDGEKRQMQIFLLFKQTQKDHSKAKNNENKNAPNINMKT